MEFIGLGLQVRNSRIFSVNIDFSQRIFWSENNSNNMVITFKKKKQILSGENLRKESVSTPVGPRSTTINYINIGELLNTARPGTEPYVRQKFAERGGSKPGFTPDNKLASNIIPLKSPKSKELTIFLAFVLGHLGVHRFYLRQYTLGILSILFIWTLIPTFIAILDVIIFAIMSQERFDEKYNSTASNCSVCKTTLTYARTPIFGRGKLKDGGQVCLKCYKCILIMDSKFSLNSKKKYDAKSVLLLLSGEYLPSTGTAIEPMDNEFSYQYYTLLKDFSESLYQMVQKLQNNEAIVERINKESESISNSSEGIVTCVFYDLIQISNILAKGEFSEDSLEATGLVLTTSKIVPNGEVLLDNDFEDIALIHQSGRYQEAARELIAYGSENLIQEPNGEKGGPSPEQPNPLSLPRILKISDNPLFEEYATVLYRYATIISKADGVVSKIEDTTLKHIYQLTHNPVPQKNNDALRISQSDKNETLDDVLNELNSLIGLNEVKLEINTLINFINVQKAREQSGLKSSPLSYHIVFTGNPGTGKTTVARIVAKIYKHLGILTQGQLVETDRSGLIAEYVGQTAVKVNKTVNSALNGVLFIDEAYSLVAEMREDYGKEAVATLVKRMEDDRDKLVLILAGYTKEMTDFIDTNPGFKSRFNRYINFPDYTPRELVEIFESKCSKLEYCLTGAAKEKVKAVFEKAYSARDKSFGNGRLVRNCFEKTLEHQANRIAKERNLTKEILTTITDMDIVEA